MRAAVAAFVAIVGMSAAVQIATLNLMKSAVTATGAMCLDGTPGGYYFAAGTGNGTNKWLVYHEGGGWCESLADCYGRSKTNLGSSNAYPASVDFDGVGGYFSTNIASNPQFYNWNKVYMKYCDGASFSGNNETTVVVNGATLYFRGKRVLDAFAADLLTNKGLKSATDLVVTGCSAGGLATYLHADKWANAVRAVSPNVKTAALPDSGFFLDYEGKPSVDYDRERRMWRDIDGEQVSIGVGDICCGVYQQDIQWVFANQNVSAGVDADCIAAYTPDQQWHCMFAEHTAPFIQTPTFPLQSEYDSWQIGNVLAVSNNPALIQQLGNNITSRLQTNLLSNPIHGVFLDSCVHHCGEWNAIGIDGLTQPVAFQQWYEKTTSQKTWIQGKAYPCSDCCQV